MGRYTQLRTFNTNVVLALESGQRVVICTGKGIGFGLHHGDEVPSERIEAVFAPEEGRAPAALAQALGLADPRCYDVAREICASAGRRLGLARPAVLVLAVADHLDQAVSRARRGVTVDIPLQWEVGHLYPAERDAGEEALRLVEDRLGVALPQAEATAFALHFVGASFDEVPVETTLRLTRTLERIFDCLDASLPTPCPRWGRSAARFVAHLRFLFSRLAEGTPSAAVPTALARALEEAGEEVREVTDRIASVIAEEWGMALSEDERGYVALHVYRLLAAPEPS